MTAPIVTTTGRHPIPSRAYAEIFDFVALMLDSVPNRTPGTLWERIAEGKTR